MQLKNMSYGSLLQRNVTLLTTRDDLCTQSGHAYAQRFPLLSNETPPAVQLQWSRSPQTCPISEAEPGFTFYSNNFNCFKSVKNNDDNNNANNNSDLLFGCLQFERISSFVCLLGHNAVFEAKMILIWCDSWFLLVQPSNSLFVAAVWRTQMKPTL